MPAVTQPLLTLTSPAQYAQLAANKPFAVSGTVSEPLSAEPPAITSITVQLDSGPLVHASFRPDPHNQNKKIQQWVFQASLIITGGTDPHTVTVVAKDDHQQSVAQTRTVFTGEPYLIDAPALVIDLATVGVLDMATVGSIQSALANAASNFAATLGDYNKMLAGPNLVVRTSPKSPANPLGSTIVRFGFWVEDFSFPVIPPDTDHGLPLPSVPDEAASAGFALVPAIPIEQPDVLGARFAVLIPTAAMQKLANAMLPFLQVAASPQDVVLNSLTVTTTDKALAVETKGVANRAGLSISFWTDIREVFGLQQVGSDDADPQRSIPGVLQSTHNASETGWLNVILGLLMPQVSIILAGASIVLNQGAATAEASATSGVKAALASLPSIIPFSASTSSLLNFIFPRLTLDWTSFGTSNLGIVGGGKALLDDRDSSMVQVTPAGPLEITGYSADLAGTSALYTYLVSLLNISPDKGATTWQTTGADGTASGPITPSTLDSHGLEAKYKVHFRMPLKPQPGQTYTFTLTVSASETSTAKEPPNIKPPVVSGSGSISVRFIVNKQPPHPPMPP